MKSVQPMTTAQRPAPRSVARRGSVGAFLRRFARDELGATSFIVIAGLPVLLGMVGLGVEVGLLYAEQRKLQIAADAAAIAGGQEMLRRSVSGDAQIIAAAKTAAAGNGAVEGQDGVSVTVVPNLDPAGNAPPRVEVAIRQTRQSRLLALISPDDIEVGADSAAILQEEGVCLLALGGGSVSNGLTIAQPLQSTYCSVASNVDSNFGVTVDAAAWGTVQSVVSYGGYRKYSSQFTERYGFRDYAREVVDPHAGKVSFASTQLPAAVGGAVCLDEDFWPVDSEERAVINGPQVFFPARRCRKTVVTATGVLTLMPGTYYFDSAEFTRPAVSHGSLIVEAGGRVICPTCTDGAGVTLVFMSSNPAIAPGIIWVQSGGILDLRAPKAGSSTNEFQFYPDIPYYLSFVNPFPGMVIVQSDFSLHAGNPQLRSTGQNIKLTGLIYMPNNPIEISGISSPAGCLQVIARRVSVLYSTSATTKLDQNGCAKELGLPEILTYAQPRLVK